jgi:glycerate kinase
LEDFSKVLDAKFKINSQAVLGGGAAGGMGIAAKVFLNGELISGITLMKELSQFDEKIKNADWIITGEGKLDDQTLSGKTIHGIIEVTKQNNINVAAFCGKLDLDEVQLKNFGISYTDAVLNLTKDIDDAMLNSVGYVTKMAERFAEKLAGK